MALIRNKNWYRVLSGMMPANTEMGGIGRRWYEGLVNWEKLRPMIQQRIKKRYQGYPIKAMIPVAQKVLQARSDVIKGVSVLLQALPVKACKFCSEVYVGETGHLIRTCCGPKRMNKNQGHRWIGATLSDILVPVKTFRLDSMSQSVIKHHQRFDFDRVPAVIELCRQAGASPINSDLLSSNCVSNSVLSGAGSLSEDELQTIGTRTLRSWEALREGVKKLMLVYTAKVCKYCSEVHVGPSGHKGRLCGVFKYQNFRGTHFWEKASVDDLVPPKIVWCRRPQDPPVLRDEGRCYYGHAPAVVDLCIKAGAAAPPQYFCMMKVQGLSGPPPEQFSG